jgi:hypothetical protein
MGRRGDAVFGVGCGAILRGFLESARRSMRSLIKVGCDRRGGGEREYGWVGRPPEGLMMDRRGEGWHQERLKVQPSRQYVTLPTTTTNRCRAVQARCKPPKMGHDER